ncbi:hypothetical protein NRIC_26950 [Enterococcus florum]|uniref:DUF58 domain-containing protein n=1 Tax=Enterococcus florum TaxID=2480627 RepID=A0A4P5PDZ4_9ENTE|nr:DUF58 domain-containing protein [Enterococcus florum]GCF94804.1 hypothetical protein NRIC_26950 [Enterococcus florum]
MRFSKIFFKIFIFLLIYAAVLLYGAVFNTNIGWTLFFLMSFLLLSSLVHFLTPSKRVQVKTTERLTTNVGKTIKLPVTVVQPLFLPFFQFQLALLADSALPVSTFLFLRGTRSATFDWPARQRGVFHSLPVQYSSSDLLFRKTYNTSLKTKLVVLPEYQRFNKKMTLQQLSQRSLFGESTFTIKNYRPYRSGDIPKNIDWKLSSKQSELMYREHETQRTTTMVWLFYGAASPLFEETLSLYYSLQDWYKGVDFFEQYLLGSQLYAQPTEQAFAELQPFTDPPKLPAFKEKQIVLVVVKKDALVQQEIRRLQENNQVSVFDHLTLTQWQNM